MTTMTGPDCAVMYNLNITHTHTHTHTHRRRASDGNGDGNGDGSEDSRGDGSVDEDDGNRNEDRIVESGREAKKRKKPQNSCRRHVGNEEGLGGKRKKCTVGKKGLVQ